MGVCVRACVLVYNLQAKPPTATIITSFLKLHCDFRIEVVAVYLHLPLLLIIRSGVIPTAKHFFRRQAEQKRRVVLSTTQLLAKTQSGIFCNPKIFLYVCLFICF